MKTKFVGLALASQALASCSSSGEGGDWWLWAIGLAVLFGFLAWIGGKEEKLKKEQQAAADKKRKELEAEFRKANADLLKMYSKVYGQPSRVIDLDGSGSCQSQVILFKESETLMLGGKPHPFAEITGYKVDDDAMTIGGNVVKTETSTDLGSLIGRTAMGHAIGGKAGAIIGGTTAKRRTRYTYADEETIHDYTVIVHLDSLDCPLVKLAIGENKRALDEVTALLDVIIRNNTPEKLAERKRSKEETEKLCAEQRRAMREASEACKRTLLEAFGRPDRVLPLDDSDDAFRQIFIYDRYSKLYFNGSRGYAFKDVQGYSVKDNGEDEKGHSWLVLVDVDDAENPGVRLDIVGGEERLRQVAALLDGIVQANGAPTKATGTEEPMPVVDGLEFSSHAGDEQAHLYFDTTHDKVLVAFGVGEKQERHVIDDFHEVVACSMRGRAWAVDPAARKSVYAFGINGERRYELYDYAAADANARLAKGADGPLPACSAACFPSSAAGGEKQYLPACLLVEETTAFMAVFTDDGMRGLNYASKAEVIGRRAGKGALITTLPNCFIVNDEACSKVIIAPPFSEWVTLDYRDIESAELVEEPIGEPGGNKLPRMYVKVHTKSGKAEGLCLEVTRDDKTIDRGTADGNQRYQECLSTARAVADLFRKASLW